MRMIMMIRSCKEYNLCAKGQFSSGLSYHGAGKAVPSAEKVDMARLVQPSVVFFLFKDESYVIFCDSG